MDKALREARRRRRRVIYNDDGCYVGRHDTPERFTDHRLRQTVGTQVDTVFYCTGVTGLFLTHFPAPGAGELVGEFVTEASHQHARLITSSVRALQASGHDPLALAVEFCHRHDQEIFWSLRMNDIHDAMAECDWLLPRYKREHPDWCLGRREYQDNYGRHSPRWWWTALNYEVSEVRDLVFRCFADVCSRYDVDGIEIDWFRSPMFFPPTLDLEDVTPEHRGMLTDLVRRIRAMTEEAAASRGRPLLVATRTPMGVARSRAIGIDIEAWLREDLTDVLTIGGGYAPMAMSASVADMVSLGRRFQVPVYPVVSNSGMLREFGSAQAWRGAAMNALFAGADGVMTFNFFPQEPDERLSQIGAVDTLKGLDKVYGVDNIDADTFEGDLRPGLVKPGRLPLPLPPGCPVTASLPVGEDIVANAPPGREPRVGLRLRIDGALAGDQAAATLNGAHLEAGKWDEAPGSEPGPGWAEFSVAPEAVREGANEVGVVLSRGGRGAADEVPALSALTLSLTYE